MKIHIKTIFTLEKYVGGHKFQTLELEEGSTLYGALERLLQMYGSPLAEKLFNGDKLRKGIIVYVNGRNSLVLEHLDTPLQDDDEVLIMPPVGGG